MKGIPKALNRGRYTITEPLGTGGMATVLRCYDHRLHAWRAAKFLLPALANKRSARRRFDTEARAMARIEHPHVIRVYDVGEEAGLPFMVMEYAPGGSLENYLEAHKRMEPALAVAALRQICEGVAAAHETGIIHRDLKPENVLISARGECKVTDFGIAQVLDDNSFTRTGSMMGTLAYMAPEQRKDAKHVSPAVDVYALGATLFSVATGAVPMDLFLAVHDQTLLDPLPPPLRPIVRRCIAIEPKNRYSSALDLERALKAVQREFPGKPDTSGLVTRTIISTEPPEPTLPGETDAGAEGSETTDPTYFPTDETPAKVLPYYMPEAQRVEGDPAYIDPERDERKAKALDRLAKLKKTTPAAVARELRAPTKTPNATPAPRTPSGGRSRTPAGAKSKKTPAGADVGVRRNVAESAVDSIQDGAEEVVSTLVQMLIRPLKPMIIPVAAISIIFVMALSIGSYRVGSARRAAIASQNNFFAAIESDVRVLEDLDAYEAPEELAAAQLDRMRKLEGPQKLKAATKYIIAVEDAVDRYGPSAPASVQHKVQMSITRLERLKRAQIAYDNAMLAWERSADTSLGRMACSTAFASCP